MYEQKTRASEISPLEVIANAPSVQQQQDAQDLLKIFGKVTGEKAVVWGEKQIGFGTYKYKYPSGHSGEYYMTGFALAKSKITLYIYFQQEDMQKFLQQLGKNTHGKSCVYINKLADIDIDVLEKMISAGIDYVKKTYPGE